MVRDKRMDGRATAPHELLLIRIGHHLWRECKKSGYDAVWGQKTLFMALETVWRLKEEIRVPLREQWLRSREKQAKRLSAHHFQKSGGENHAK